MLIGLQLKDHAGIARIAVGGDGNLDLVVSGLNGEQKMVVAVGHLYFLVDHAERGAGIAQQARRT